MRSLQVKIAAMQKSIKYILAVCCLGSIFIGNAYSFDTKYASNARQGEANGPASGAVCAKLLRQKLAQVIDPELGINVIDLGIVREIQCDPQRKASRITMLLTSPLCPYIKELVADMKAAAKRAFPDYDVKIVVDMKTRWTPALLSEEGRKRFMGHVQ